MTSFNDKNAATNMLKVTSATKLFFCHKVALDV